MRTNTLCVLVFTLWVATSVGTAYNSRGENSVTSFNEASNRFSVDLMKEVFKQPGNFIMSPLSVSTLLAMLQQGARQNSSQQLDHILHMNSEKALQGFSHLLASLKDQSTRSVFNFGNSMFVNQDFDLISDYKEAVVRNFHATAESVDFRNPSAAAQKINQWVWKMTQGKIPEIMKAESITGRTELVLANAMYFKGAWLNPFYFGHNQKIPFHKDGGDSVTVDMMVQNFTMRAGEEKESLNAKWIEMPYDGYGLDYAMVVVLPNDNLDAMMSRITGAHLAYLSTANSVRDVILRMPKFKFETDLSLVPTLQALGLSDVFNQNSNLEGISTSKSPLVVSDVLHKAQIDVDENGTEAAAASAIQVNTLSLSPQYEKLFFTADRPFLAMIIDKTSNLPMFVAKVADPSIH